MVASKIGNTAEKVLMAISFLQKHCLGACVSHAKATILSVDDEFDAFGA